MKYARHLSLALVLLAAAQARPDPPVTGKDAPPPGPAQVRLWLEALLQAPVADYFRPGLARSEPLRMLLAVQRGERLGPGAGWYAPSQRRHDWAWLAAHADADHDGRVRPREFPGPREWFGRLDRDRSGAVTADDLDWSRRSDWVRRAEHSLRLLRGMDADGNG